MISLLLAISLTCPEVKDLISKVRSNDSIPDGIKSEIVTELLLVAPEGCLDLQTELSR